MIKGIVTKRAGTHRYQVLAKTGRRGKPRIEIGFITKVEKGWTDTSTVADVVIKGKEEVTKREPQTTVYYETRDKAILALVMTAKRFYAQRASIMTSIQNNHFS